MEEKEMTLFDGYTKIYIRSKVSQGETVCLPNTRIITVIQATPITLTVYSMVPCGFCTTIFFSFLS